jgi:YbgC/YbaW family acyl-CoA thioester hydrolase
MPTHETSSSFQVRSYEIDSYAHLNNGIYISWFEQGRLDYLESLGFSYDDFADRREWFVVRRTEVDFRRPLGVGDLVSLSTRIEKLGRSSVRFAQVMRSGKQPGTAGADAASLVCEAHTVMVFSGEGGGSIPIPDDFRAAVEGV